jgi:hypothetical protein
LILKKSKTWRPTKGTTKARGYLGSLVGYWLTHRKYSYEEAKNWGLLGWVRPLINITLDGSSESVDCQLEQLLPRADDSPPQYYRFQAFLSTRSESMDTASPQISRN